MELHQRHMPKVRRELGAGNPRVKKHPVRRIDAVFVDLEPIAGHSNGVRQKSVAGQIVDVELRERRTQVRRPHISEEEAAKFVNRVSAMEDTPTQRATVFFARRFENCAVHVVEPAVIATPQAVGFDPSELERGSAMATMTIKQPDAAVEGAK